MLADAIARVRGDVLAERALRGRDFTHVIALGKAAEALAHGAWRAAGGCIEGGFVALPRGYTTGELPRAAPFEYHLGGHPLPDRESLAAGAALARFVAALPRAAVVAVLLSGGASATVELPAAGIDLRFLRRATRWLLGSGLPIEAVNRVRVRLSRLKGGGLAGLLGRRRAGGWVLSDVAPADPLWVAGAPLGAVPPGPLPAAVPAWLSARLDAVDRPCAASVPLECLGGNADAVAAVQAQGAEAWPDLGGDAAELGADLAGRLLRSPPGIYVSGGEPTVRLPPRPGRGGRCQQLALAAAVVLAGRDDCRLLAAGTDGHDGTDPVAGACIDGGTVARGRAAGLDPDGALSRADAGRFLAASGDRVTTGPTGTNVNDLVIALRG